ncbi:MAG: hypothetical protein CMJ16_03525 [Peredibacter sp.]|nr:hypothetical protein [Peredibacter sp.]
MEVNFQMNGIQINYLSPLKKWRLLDLRNLMKACNYEASYISFVKMILRLEKKRMVGSAYDPFTRRKYLYLTKEGNNYLGGDDSPPSISKETFVHDAKVVELILELMKLNCFYGFELEHEISAKSNFKVGYKICPDAILMGEKKKKKFKLALELELTRKTKSKYLGKISQYLDSSYYDYVFYLFQNKGVLESYKATTEDKFGVQASKKILFGLNENLLSRSFDLAETNVHFKEKEIKIHELFN